MKKQISYQADICFDSEFLTEIRHDLAQAVSGILTENIFDRFFQEIVEFKGNEILFGIKTQKIRRGLGIVLNGHELIVAGDSIGFETYFNYEKDRILRAVMELYFTKLLGTLGFESVENEKTKLKKNILSEEFIIKIQADKDFTITLTFEANMSQLRIFLLEFYDLTKELKIGLKKLR